MMISPTLTLQFDLVTACAVRHAIQQVQIGDLFSALAFLKTRSK